MYLIVVANACMPSVRDGWMVGRLLDVLLINHRTTAHNALHCWGLCLPRPVSAPAIYFISFYGFLRRRSFLAQQGELARHTDFCHQGRRKYLFVLKSDIDILQFHLFCTVQLSFLMKSAFNLCKSSTEICCA
jgi:hypothetical protein